MGYIIFSQPALGPLLDLKLHDRPSRACFSGHLAAISAS